MNQHLQNIESARVQGKIVKEYVGGAYSIQTPGKLVGTVYKPDGTEYRAALTESLDELFAHDYPRK